MTPCLGLTSAQRANTGLKVVFEKMSFSKAKHKIQRVFFSSNCTYIGQNSLPLFSLLLYVIIMHFNDAIQVVQDYTH